MVTRTKDAPASSLFLEPEPPLALPSDNRLRVASTIEWPPASSIGTDRRVNTRPVDTGWVDAKSKPDVFNWNYLGTVAVSRRDDGSMISVDGQHRIALLAAIGKPDAELKCEVFTGLSLAQEAGLFLGLNDDRTIRPVSKFIAQVTMGDPLCSEILRIVEDCSWRITAVPGRGVLNCVTALTRIHTNDIKRNTKGGFEPQALRSALTAITKSWGTQDQAGHESIVSGLGMLMVRDGQVIRDDRTGGLSGMDRLIAVLETYGRDPSGLLVKAKAYQGSHVPPISLPKAIAELVSEGWNRGKQSRRLASFVR